MNKGHMTCSTFAFVIISWWSIWSVNITFGDDPEYETKEIRELLDESNGP
jgi:hypothetical protein